MCNVYTCTSCVPEENKTKSKASSVHAFHLIQIRLLELNSVYPNPTTTATTTLFMHRV